MPLNFDNKYNHLNTKYHEKDFIICIATYGDVFRIMREKMDR